MEVTVTMRSLPISAARTPATDAAAVRAGVRIELLTIVYMVIEAAVAIAAGVVARSVLLTAFGIDSVIELATGGILLWRLVTEARDVSLERVERAERRAAWIVGIALVGLCIYVVVSSVTALALRIEPERSTPGLVLAIAAVVLMPLLARRKRGIADCLSSAALRGDAACSITCAYMAGALLLGLGLNAAFGWWWADPFAALVLLFWLSREAREAIAGARAGKGACSCGDDDCHH